MKQVGGTYSSLRVAGCESIVEDSVVASVLAGLVGNRSGCPRLKDALGRYLLLRGDDLEAAIELASKIPAARMGDRWEVRPLKEQ
jgi:hypothetical protein